MSPPAILSAFWVKATITILAAIVLAAGAALITFSNIVPPAMGMLAMRMPLGGSAEVRAAAAGQIIEWTALAEAGGVAIPPEDKAATAGQAADMARSALQQEPVNVEAARTLGLAMTMLGDDDRAQRLYLYAQTLSRRDAPTQTALAERALRDGRSDDAAEHFGRVLATSLSARDATLARMVSASNDPAFQDALGRKLAARPSWGSDFLKDFAALVPSPVALYRVAAPGWANGWPDAEEPVALLVTGRLIELGAPDRAWSLYRMGAGESRAAQPLRNGGFEDADTAGPFEWRYTNSARMTALPVPSTTGTGNVLSLQSSSGTSSVAARQTIRLAPGAYRISLRAGDVGRDRFARPELWITCLGADQPLAKLIAPPAPTAGLASAANVTVPGSGCSFQVAELRFGAPATAARNEAWVDDVAIAPLR